ncbi:hypothetical protein Rsub_10428 [Raphidocelis subcapitata]|uniref:non-specific serine/threonine protein kinase n=1 Tax=Raphidocelis subcapitata TaxID=307507 RepID=A0A2V0PKE5_9CHLO|nr:hypothetical protein Rsub_10428 [Raphidocelis subcapitata]|eukprot:GBF97505.1 hypothetical protein Rsub_10428 [Raphidocelis subcapitata]
MTAAQRPGLPGVTAARQTRQRAEHRLVALLLLLLPALRARPAACARAGGAAEPQPPKSYCWEWGSPPREVPGGLHFESVAAASSGTHACGIEWRSGKAYCWGQANWMGKFVLGRADVEDSAVPVEVSGAPRLSSLSVGRAHACGLEADTGAAWCWGSWDGGANVLGHGRAASSPGAVKVLGGHTFESIYTSMMYSAALDREGHAWWWGGIPFVLPSSTVPGGRVGQLTPYSVDTVVPLPGNHSFSRLAGGFYHACGLTKGDGHVLCWGCWCTQDELDMLSHGRPGGPKRTDVCAEVPVGMAGGPGFVDVAASFHSACGLRASGEVVCWASLKGAPSTAIQAGSGINRIVGGWWSRYCGLTPGGAARCWGGGERPEAPGLKFASLSAGWRQACGVEVSERPAQAAGG